MRFLRYVMRLGGEFWGFAIHNKAWWIIPLVIVLLLLAALIFIGETTAPFIYTLF